MKVALDKLMKIALTDDKKATAKKLVLDSIDNKKRDYFLGMGSVLASLGGCAAPIDPDAEPIRPPESPLAYTPTENVAAEVCEEKICINDAPNGLPGAPATPVTTTPTTLTPVVDLSPVVDPPRSTPIDTTPRGVVVPVQTFTSLGPVLANLDTSNMQSLTDVQIMSDGNPIQVWGFTSSAGAAFNGDTGRLCPGPVIECIEGQSMTIALRSQHPHTLHLHGLDVDQANDGTPSTSGFVAQMDPVPPFFRPPGAWLGNPFEYKFIAPHAGTYMYHCHVDTVLHVEMGMSGTIIVRPPDGRKNETWDGGHVFKREYIWQLHTFDSSWHDAPSGTGSSTLRYSPDYFMINGRDGTDILSDPTAAIKGYAGEGILIRLVNLGYQPAIINLGGILFDVVASDGRPLKQLFFDLFSEILIAPGERYDIMFNMPATGVASTSVKYLDIQGRRILGTANSTITSL